MRIYPKVTIRFTDSGFYAIPEPYYEYFGPLWGAKKGDKQKQNAQQQAALAGTQTAYGNKEQGIQDTYRNTTDPFISSLVPKTTGGPMGVGGSFPGSNASIAGGTGATAQMSPYAAAQYGSDVENISNTYNNLRQNAFKTLGARGFGNAPAGMTSSLINNSGNQQAQALTGAYRTGLQNTLNEGLAAADYSQKGQSLYNPNPSYSGANQSYSGSSNSATQGDTMAGSTFKNILGAATGIASAFIPGAGFASLLGRDGSGGGAPMTDLSMGSSSTADALLNSGALGNNANWSPTQPGFGGLSKYAPTGPATFGGGKYGGASGGA